MRIFFLLLLIVHFNVFATDCRQEGSSCDSNKSLSDSFKTITLKTAMILNDLGLETLEDYAKLQVPYLDESYELLFDRYFLPSTWEPFKETIPLANYWKANSRFDNHASLATLLMINTKHDNYFSKEELSLMRLLGHTTNLENISHFNLSSQVIKLTGGIKDQKQISHEEVEHLIQSLGQLDCVVSSDFIEEINSKLYEHETIIEYDDGKLVLADEVEINIPKFSLQRVPELKNEIIDHRDRIDIAVSFKRNKLKGEKAIHFYHQNYNFDEYVVINKRKQEYTVFREGEIVERGDIKLERDDKRARGGAGIYHYSGNNELFNENGRYEMSLPENIPLDDGSRVYILPENEKEHDFHIKNHSVMFNSNIKRKSYASYNYSLRDNYEISTDFFVPNKASRFKKDFVQALEDEKKNLMKLYKMDSDTYNELARFAYGIMGIESKFGKSLKYKVKETLPYVVSVMKGNGLDISENSMGPTQMKKVPSLISKHYAIDKSDLSEARSAAIATVGFSYEILQDLKRLAPKHKAINSKNIFDYLYYVYQGQRSEITKATATPDKSIRIRMIKDAYSELSIIDRV